MTYCEDYPCCGHTDGDPCPGRSVITEPWYCDDCGIHHVTDYCTEEWDNEDEDDEPDDYDPRDDTYWSGTGELMNDDSYIDYLNRY